ncbi:replication initiation protein, partial [Aureimonas psammosilenae]|uniref:replication initiation protein n=1 Tax=Aureimonas psammosilenae TaxID=2495496 RepID=UPI00126058D8
VEEAIEALMRSILTVRMSDGKTRRVQFLGGNDMDDPDRPAGVLTYSFDKRLVEVLKQSSIWGKIAIPVLMAFTTKYAVSLYENAAQFANLEFKTFADYSLDEAREMLGVQPGKYKTFGEFNLHVLKPALTEINALAPFNLSALPIKQGKKVTGVRVTWWKKSSTELSAAYEEVNRPKAGRKARLSGTVEHMVSEPMPSVGRLMRNARKAAKPPKTS